MSLPLSPLAQRVKAVIDGLGATGFLVWDIAEAPSVRIFDARSEREDLVLSADDLMQDERGRLNSRDAIARWVAERRS